MNTVRTSVLTSYLVDVGIDGAKGAEQPTETNTSYCLKNATTHRGISSIKSWVLKRHQTNAPLVGEVRFTLELTALAIIARTSTTYDWAQNSPGKTASSATGGQAAHSARHVIHMSALWGAVKYGHDHIVRILLNHGTDVVGGAESIASAMGFALRDGRAVVLDTLLGHPKRDDDRRQLRARWKRSTDDRTLFHVAVLHGHLTTASVLLAASADETALDTNGLVRG